MVLRQPHHKPQSWSFDYVAADSTTQEELFQGELAPCSFAQKLCLAAKPRLSERIGIAFDHFLYCCAGLSCSGGPADC